MAALCGYQDCTSLLIDYGANVYQRNLQSKRPADLATDTACRKILQAKAGEYMKVITLEEISPL
jgi:ankyrin repeat protein